jgi:hypothetical protein
MTSERACFRVTTPHNGATDWHEWFFPNGWRDIGPTEQRDRAGRARGKRDGYMQKWFVLACNNTDCEARAVVPVSMVTDFADRLDPSVESTR